MTRDVNAHSRISYLSRQLGTVGRVGIVQDTGGIGIERSNGIKPFE